MEGRGVLETRYEGVVCGGWGGTNNSYTYRPVAKELEEVKDAAIKAKATVKEKEEPASKGITLTADGEIEVRRPPAPVPLLLGPLLCVHSSLDRRTKPLPRRSSCLCQSNSAC